MKPSLVESGENEPRPVSLVDRCAAPLLLALVAFAILAATNRDYGYAIDEATYVWVARQQRQWFRDLPDRGLATSLTPEAIAERWHFLEAPTGEIGKHSNFNLPLSMHLMNLGWAATSWAVDELTSYRFASMALFAICIADVFRTVRGSLGLAAAVFSSLALLAMPRIVGHAHLAATETSLSCFWIMTCLAMVRMNSSDSQLGSSTARKAAVVAILLSLAMTVKFTGWLLAPAVVVWMVLVRPKHWKLAVVLCAVVPPIAIVALTPNLWHDPFTGITEGLRVARDNPWTIPTYYLAEGYTGRLPGVSGLVLLSATTPISLLALSVSGLAGGIRNASMWAVGLPTLGLLAARLAGMVPTHDGDRQFLPVYYGVAVLSGFGFDAILRSVLGLFQRRADSTAGVVAAVVMAASFLAEPIVDAWTYRSFGLSYYNRAVGGLAGADRLGFEVSYWFEAMTNDAWRRMLADLPENAKVFFRPDHPGMADLQAWGIVRGDLQAVGPDQADFDFLYAKRAAYLIPDPNGGRPAYTDLGVFAERGRMDREIRFDGVRIVGLRRHGTGAAP